jgi:hypothetical protein
MTMPPNNRMKSNRRSFPPRLCWKLGCPFYASPLFSAAVACSKR